MSEKKSSFSVTCSLLSQFHKEKRSLAEIGVPRPPEPNKGLFRPPIATMSLLPGVDVSAEIETETETDRNETVTAKSMELFPQHAGIGSVDKKPETKEPEKSQLTIFYGGKVLVFDNFPADMVPVLVQLAAKGSSSAAPAAPSTASALADRPPVGFPSTSGRKPVPEQQPTPELSMPRRASLHRFFAKRKDRITSNAPYQVNGNSSSVSDPGKPKATRSWLGLDPEDSNPNPDSVRR